MSEDTTRKFDERPFEERVFEELRNINTELRAVNARITTLEESFAALDEKVDRRLMETRPIWQAVQSSLEDISGQMRELSVDMLQMRSRVSRLEDRSRTPAA